MNVGDRAQPPADRDGRRHRAASPSSPATATRCTTTRRSPRPRRFGGIVVQGGVTTGLLNAVVAEDLPGPGSVFLHTDWSYRAPVRPGDTITAEVEVLEQRETSPSASCAPRSPTRTATSSSRAPPSSGASHSVPSAPEPRHRIAAAAHLLDGPAPDAEVICALAARTVLRRRT